MPKTKEKIQTDPTDNLFQQVDNLFAPEEVETKGKVHYLRFDQTPIKMSSGDKLIPATDGWAEISAFLRATDAKTMMRNLIGIAILANKRRRELRETKSKQETLGEEESQEG